MDNINNINDKDFGLLVNSAVTHVDTNNLLILTELVTRGTQCTHFVHYKMLYILFKLYFLDKM